MERIGRVTSRFKDVTEVQVKSNKSSEASKYGVQDMGIVINERTKLSADFDEKELYNAIVQEQQSQ
jgi:ribosome-associated translation inhibitor RaiA